MSETFIKIDSLQHLKISRQIYPTNLSKIRATTFTVLTLCYFSKLMKLMRTTIHIPMTSTCLCEYCQCFTFKDAIKFKL